MYAISVLEKIKELSLLESNSLTRRQVKTMEEMGELSLYYVLKIQMEPHIRR